MNKTALALHQKAEKLREEDKHLLALKFANKAFLKYQINKNYLGISFLLQERALIYKHLYLLEEDKLFTILALKNAESSLLISQKFNLNNIHTCYFKLGEIFILTNNFSKAILNYEKALKFYPKNNSEKGVYEYHLGEALYLNGDKKLGLETLLKGLENIKRFELKTDDFLINVWKSGCYICLARILKIDNFKNAKKYFHLAQKIIELDKRLIIRKRQLLKLNKEFN